MPIRPRRERRGGIVWTPDVAMALDFGPTPRPGSPSDGVLAAAWERFGSRLTAEHVERHGPLSRPWGWWRFAEVPDELRAERPKLVPVDEAEAADREVALMELARATWLAAESAT